jgi:hypothetical protein
MPAGLPWMQPPPQGKPSDSGKKPQKQTLHVHIAAGVFSETSDYNGPPKIRPELSCPTISNNLGGAARWEGDRKLNNYERQRRRPNYLRWLGRRQC